jgi:hypothetical protein
MSKTPINSELQWIGADGKPTLYFLELIQNLQKNGLGQAVSSTAPTNGQVLKYVTATGLWTPGTDNT